MAAKILFILIFLCPHLGFSQSKNKVWKEEDRKDLLVRLKLTQLNLVNTISDLDENQLHFKPDSTKWSIADVLEHLAVYEELLFWDLTNNQYTPELPEFVESVSGKDSLMLAYANDPNNGQAPFIAQPIGRFHHKEDLINYFNRFRNEVIKLIEETDTDFRLHFIFRPADWGIWHRRDLHQYTLLWISHTERHLNQIRKNINHINFPK